ncbi:MAG: AraC family transcriptional regulator [Clostridia bacterium]|nr:AraC family transcriptional regulator [Clostridia bacterium]
MNGVSIISAPPAENGQALTVYSLGLESTVPGKTVGPCVRDRYVIHYVLGGHGSFNGTPLQRGMGFVICPGQRHTYISDTKDPLQYGWVSFGGPGAEGLLRDAGIKPCQAVFACPWVKALDGLYATLCRPRHGDADAPRYLEGCLYILISFHNAANQAQLPHNPPKSLMHEHVEAAMQYVNEHYCHRLSIAEVAGACYVSAHYLSNIFKKELGISPQQYLINLRMKRACELLAGSRLSITDVANSVGYADVLAFSKIFYKVYGMSPSTYRASLAE